METQTTEYKQQWDDKYLAYISGFANAQGGTIYVGINDMGEVVGVNNAKYLLENLPVLPNLQFGRQEYQHFQCENKCGCRATTALQPHRWGCRAVALTRFASSNLSICGCRIFMVYHYIEKSEIPIFFSCCKFCNNCQTIPIEETVSSSEIQNNCSCYFPKWKQPSKNAVCFRFGI